jgi:SAM-dependent methyltransferase
MQNYITTAIKYPDEVCKFAIRVFKRMFFGNRCYHAFPGPKIRARVPHQDLEIQNKIIEELKRNGFNVADFVIDVDDYLNYMTDAEYEKFPHYHKGGRTKDFSEKSLEHYLAAKFLDLSKNDLYIDIANKNSPAPDIYHKLYGCQVYKQDLIFPVGIKQNTIGGDASNLPLTDGFATKMALHCSFEHFEQDSDIRFIKEANRVIRKNGKLCILPLYLFNRYAMQLDPLIVLKNNISLEKDSMFYCTVGYGNRPSRFYDIYHLITRIRDNLTDLKLTIYVVRNGKDISPFCYIKFVALFEKT